MRPEEVLDRLTEAAARYRLKAYAEPARPCRFEISLAMWTALRDWIDLDLYPREAPTRAGYRLLGYPFVVDPNLPDDALRFVEMPRRAVA